MADRKLRYSLRLERDDIETLRVLHREELERALLEDREAVAEATIARKIFRRGLRAIGEERAELGWLKFFQPVTQESNVCCDFLLIFTDPPNFPADDCLRSAGADVVNAGPWPNRLPRINRDSQLRLSQPLKRMLITDNGGAEFLVEIFGYKFRRVMEHVNPS